MFSIGTAGLLALQKLEGTDQPMPGVSGKDDVINISSFGSQKRVHIVFAVGFHLFTEHGVRIGGLLYLPAVDDLSGTSWSHDGDLCCRPGVINVALNMFGVHYNVGTTIGLAHNDRDTWYRSLGEGIEEFRTVANNAAVLLFRSRHESWNINQADEGNVKSVAEADKARCLK